MNLLRLLVLSLFSLLIIESSSLPDDNSSDITRGSSLSTSSNVTGRDWLSPSGNIAFGFYKLPCTHSTSDCHDEYVVGIWFAKSSRKTLVWTANRDDIPLHKPSSILFTDEGKLVLRIIPDNKDKLLLPDVPESASYAKMHDDGNFVLYGSDSQIVWESFDYPTDTMLGGQKLRPGCDLVSGNHRLSVKQANGFFAIYKKYIFKPWERDDNIAAESVSVISDERQGSLSRPVFLRLDITGKLYLANSYDEVVEVFYEGRQKRTNEEGDYIYRATLSSIGRFNLHKERIDGNGKSFSIVWSSYKRDFTKVLATIGSLAFLAVLTVGTAKILRRRHLQKDVTGGDLELVKE